MIKERRTYCYMPGNATYTLRCDGCQKVVRTTALTMGEMKDKFKEYGWHFPGGLSCYCSECAKQMDEE